MTHWQATEGTVQVGEGDKAIKGYVTAEMAEALTHYLQAAQVLPPWADARKIERAEKLFMDHGALSEVAPEKWSS